MSLLTRYRSVLSADGAPAAFAFSLVGRLSLGMTGLALLLLVRASTGSYAAAGAVSASYALAFAVGSPARARSADRRGPVVVLLRCAVAHPLALVAIALLASVEAPVVALSVMAVVAGLTVPPLGAVMRTLWGRMVTGPALATAYSLESVAVELCFVVAPGLVAVIVSTLSPGAALAASGLTVLVGALGLGRNRAVRGLGPDPDAVHTLIGPLASPAVRSLLMTIVWIGTGFGAVEVAMPAFAEAQGSRPAAAGILLAVWSAGSIVGGLAYGGISPTRPASRQLPWLIAALAVASSLPMLADSSVLMGLALVLYGMTIAPFFACNSVLLASSAPPGTTTEAFAWGSSMIFAGVALGTSVGGGLAEAHGPAAALGVTAAAGALTLVTSLLGLKRVQAA